MNEKKKKYANGFNYDKRKFHSLASTNHLFWLSRHPPTTFCRLLWLPKMRQLRLTDSIFANIFFFCLKCNPVTESSLNERIVIFTALYSNWSFNSLRIDWINKMDKFRIIETESHRYERKTPLCLFINGHEFISVWIEQPTANVYKVKPFEFEWVYLDFWESTPTTLKRERKEKELK